VALFRAGHDEAFRVIHDRYHQRLFAYTRQMLPGCRQDAEDALQDVFVRAYAGLRSSDRELALRAWLYRVAHNRCIDELRRPAVPAPELLEFVRPPIHDPIAEAEQRESLRRLIADLRRLPQHQRSALLMRELSGMTYSELAAALGVSVPAVKSLLVRARVGLAQALEARETACSEIHDELVLAHDRRVRPNATARRHMRDCVACRQFHGEIRGMSKQFAALLPALGPFGLLANVLGFGGAGGGAAAGGSAAVGGGAALAGGTGGAFAAGGVLATGAGHIATLLAAAVVTAGGAVEIQGTISAPLKHRTHHHATSAAAAGSPSSEVATANRSVTAVPDTSPASVAPVAPSARPAAVPDKAPAATKSPKSGSLATGSRGGAPTGSTSSTSGGSPADAGTGTGGSGTAVSMEPTPGALPTDGSQPAGTGSSTSGTPSPTPGGPANTSSGTIASGPSGTSTESGTGGAQSGSSSSLSVTVSTTIGSDSGSGGNGAVTGSSGTSH
jgi:RNA polymerase sigma factor (sigma-70 family)